jgi:hypothetical protein
MILKFLQRKDAKEVPLEEGITSLPQLKIEVGKFVKLDESSVLLSFIDIDDELVEIHDEYDFEYMLEQGKGKAVVHVNLVNEQEPEAKEKSPKVDLQEKFDQQNQESTDENCQQILTPQFMNSLVEGTDPKNAFVQTQDSNLRDVVLVERGTSNDDEFHIHNGNYENTLDLSVIKVQEEQKFEVVDNKYNFTKQKVPSNEVNYVEDNVITTKALICPPQDLKPHIDEIIESNSTLQELKMKIEALTELVNKGFTAVKNDISVLSAPEAQSKSLSSLKDDQVTHYGVSCDCCKARPIRGKRFKCLVCPDFDLCASCEDNNRHPHPKMVFYDQMNINFAEEMTTLCRLKAGMNGLDDKEIKVRILKNIIGDKYDAIFYENFVNERKKKSMTDFMSEVFKIFG